jgi:hypothetical protein
MKERGEEGRRRKTQRQTNKRGGKVLWVKEKEAMKVQKR